MGATASQAIRNWKYVDTSVFNANSPNPSAWTSLDLQSVVGLNNAFVLLSIDTSAGNAAGYAFKRYGEAANALPEGWPGNAGGCHSVDVKVNGIGYIAIQSNVGVIEWYCDVVDNQTRIRVVGFIKEG